MPRQAGDGQSHPDHSAISPPFLGGHFRASGPTQKETLSDMNFLFSENGTFPTWWTRMPSRDSLITGWAPFRSAQALSHRPESFITSRALTTLSELLRLSQQELEREL